MKQSGSRNADNSLKWGRVEDMEYVGPRVSMNSGSYVPDEAQTGFETLFNDSQQTQNKVLLQSSDDNADHSLQMWDGYCSQPSLPNEALNEWRKSC